MKENAVNVEIGYALLEQTIISEEKKFEVNDLVSSIGGVLGVFLGLSFLNLIEIVEIFLQTLLVFVERGYQIKS